MSFIEARLSIFFCQSKRRAAEDDLPAPKRGKVAHFKLGADMWVGAAAQGGKGGTAGVSDSFVDGINWLDFLCLAPHFGTTVVLRQAFYTECCYELYGPYPHPDYWTSVLFKRLIGTKVLDVPACTNPGRLLRVYAFCASQYPGGVVFVAVNIRNETALFEIDEFLNFPRYEYRLTAPGNDLTSQQIELNGVVLEAMEGGGLPPLDPIIITTNTPMFVEPFSYSFFLFPEARAPAC